MSAPRPFGLPRLRFHRSLASRVRWLLGRRDRRRQIDQVIKESRWGIHRPAPEKDRKERP